MLTGELDIYVEGAVGIKDTALFGKGTPYCSLTLGNQTFKSPPIPGGGTHPYLNTKFHFNVEHGSEVLHVSVFSQNKLVDDTPLGSCAFAINDVFRSSRDIPLETYALTRPSGKPGGGIRLSLTFKPRNVPRRNPQLRPRAPHGQHPRPESHFDPPPEDYPLQRTPAGPVRPRPQTTYFDSEQGSLHGSVHGSDGRSPRSDYGRQPFDQPQQSYQHQQFLPPPLNAGVLPGSGSSESDPEDNSRPAPIHVPPRQEHPYPGAPPVRHRGRPGPPRGPLLPGRGRGSHPRGRGGPPRSVGRGAVNAPMDHGGEDSDGSSRGGSSWGGGGDDGNVASSTGIFDAASQRTPEDAYSYNDEDSIVVYDPSRQGGYDHGSSSMDGAGGAAGFEYQPAAYQPPPPVRGRAGRGGPLGAGRAAPPGSVPRGRAGPLGSAPRGRAGPPGPIMRGRAGPPGSIARGRGPPGRAGPAGRAPIYGAPPPM